MFNKILFATTASPACDHAARVAFDIAGRYNAEITVFHILGIPKRGFSQYVTDVRTGEEEIIDNDYLQWVREEIKNTYANQLEKCKKYSIEALAGIPHTEILRFARKNEMDLIVMGPSTREEDEEHYAYRQTAGNTLQAVTKSARCPVLIISRPAASFWGGFSNIVFGTDFSKAADEAFMFAYNTAKTLGNKLYIFHAFDISSLHAGKLMGQDEIEDKIMDALKKIRKLYVTRMGDFKNYEIEVWEGIPYVEIVKFCREKYADLLIMAHHTREIAPEKISLGSTVEQVSLRATCPVVSVNRAYKLKNV